MCLSWGCRVNTRGLRLCLVYRSCSEGVAVVTVTWRFSHCRWEGLLLWITENLSFCSLKRSLFFSPKKSAGVERVGLSSFALWCHQRHVFVSVHQHILGEPLQAHKMIAAALGMLFAFRLECWNAMPGSLSPSVRKSRNYTLPECTARLVLPSHWLEPGWCMATPRGSGGWKG